MSNIANVQNINDQEEYLNDPKQHWQKGLTKTETINCLEETKEFVDRAYSVLRKFQTDPNFTAMIFDQDGGQEIFMAMVEGIMSHESRPDVLDAMLYKIKTD